jgi:dTDP-4-dehydrorhamnose 3,5-epimerase
MEVKETGIEGLLEIYPLIYYDARGWFFEMYNEDTFHQHNINYRFVQQNHSYSLKGVLRGLHFQRPPYAQAKLVTVVKGKVLDVVVDIRSGSKTFGKVYYCMLDSEKRNMLMVPEGFAHGFSALEDTLFAYKCTSTYNREAEGGIVWNDPDLQINWQIEKPIVSEKDASLPSLAELMRKSVILQ